MAGFPEVARKGAMVPHTSLKGNRFSFLENEEMLSLRFSKEEQESFIAENDTIHSIQYSAVMIS